MDIKNVHDLSGGRIAGRRADDMDEQADCLGRRLTPTPAVPDTKQHRRGQEDAATYRRARSFPAVEKALSCRLARRGVS